MKRHYFFVILLAYGCSLERSGASSLAPGGFDAGPHTGGADGDIDGSPADGFPDPVDGTPGDGSDGDPSGDGTTGDGAPGDGTDQPGDGSPDDAGSNVMPTPDAGMSIPDAGMAEPDAGTPGFTPPPGQVGAPCEEDDECTGINRQCIDKIDGIDIPNGYCTHGCLATCGPRERCVENLCARTCATNADCRAPEGFRCIEGLCLIPGTEG